MGQTEIYNFLKENPGKWFTAKDIRDVFNLNLSSISRALTVLKKDNFIHYKIEIRNKHYYMYDNSSFKDLVLNLFEKGYINYKARDKIISELKRKNIL